MLLVLLRMVQGFSTGGEYGGAAMFMAEYAPGRRRGFFGSFLEFGTLAGFTATFPAMFPTQVRYAGFAIAYNVATALFGGTAPAFNDKLISLTGDDLVPAYTMMASCVVGAVALAFVPETARASIRGTGVPGIDTQPKPLQPATR